MNANFGIVAPIAGKFRGKTAKKDKNYAVPRSLEQIDRFADTISKIKKSGSRNLKCQFSSKKGYRR